MKLILSFLRDFVASCEKRKLAQSHKATKVTPVLLAFALLALPAALHADSNMPAAELADTQLPDPAQEAQASALMETLRCVVCQGQSIADSDAELAGDMRSMVRSRIRAGETPEQIRAWMVERYGEEVSYAPPLSARTGLLWLAPLLLLGAGIWLARGRFRKRAR